MEPHATAADIPPLLDKADSLEGFWVIGDMSDLTDATWSAWRACRCLVKRDEDADCVDTLEYEQRTEGQQQWGRQVPGVGGVHSLQAGQDGGKALLQEVNAHQHIAVAG